MIALTSPYLWYSTRATGLVAMVLLTVVVCLGALVAMRVGGSYIGRFELNEVHRSLSMLAMVFVGLHVITTVADSYVSTGPLSIVVPLTSSYKRLDVSLGAVGFDLLLAVWISSLLKVRIKNQSWRFIHWFSWVAVGTAILHALQTGTDTHKGVGWDVAIACLGSSALAGAARALFRPTRAGGRTALSPLRPIAKVDVPTTPSAFPRVQPPRKGRS